MNISMFKAWSAGAGIIILMYTAWSIALQASQYSKVLVILLWASPLAAAIVTSYLAPYKKILLGVSMVLPTTIMTVTLNYVYQWLGNAVDFPGVRGGLILFTTTLVYSGIICLLGSMGGMVLARISHGRN
ncbi:MAG: hypothetical protein PVF08_01500 [Gammaproteobacteria bacterium]